jgi:5'-3' exonuclease
VELIVVDGTYELFRAYFGAPERKSPGGREVGATIGLMQSMLALLRDHNVTHIAAATDTVVRSFRNDLFDGYKTGDDIEEPLLSQFPLAERALETLGMKVWRMVDYEADDALATAATAFKDSFDRVIIASPDKDLCQCVDGTRVQTLNRRKQEYFDHEGVVEKFGVPPVAIPDYLALVGDTADRIPGVPRWGPKSASTLLARHGSLEAIPDDPLDWDVAIRGAERLAASLRERREDAGLYKLLATLVTDVDLGTTLDDLDWQGVPYAAFMEFCDELGVDHLKTRPHRWAE